MSELERDIGRWIESVDRPVPVEAAMAGGQTRRGFWPTWLPVPVAAVGALAVLLLGVAVALAGGDGDDDVVVADDAVTSTTTSTPSPTTSSTVETTVAPSTTIEATTTTPPSTSVPPTVPSTTAPTEVPPSVPSPDGDGRCDAADVRAEVAWESTGDRSEIAVAAGTSARYVLTRTNTGPETCTVSARHCGGGEQLTRRDGGTVDRPISLACPAVAVPPISLAPGESVDSTSEVGLELPPGRYLVEVPTESGSDSVLPVRLEDRHAACPASALRLTANGTSSVSADGHVHSELASSTPDCSIRGARVTVVVDPDGSATQHADTDAFWIVAKSQSALLFHDVGAISAPSGTHVAEVSLVLEGGATLSYRTQVRIP